MVRKKHRQDISAQIAALDSMTLSALRAQWTKLYGPAPAHRAADMVRAILAWRIQADAYGGLSTATTAMLMQDDRPSFAAERPGMRLARDYAGRRHEVVITDQGIAYDGAVYASLSAVARRITGQRWNGPRFFGLRRENSR